jgi:hypothetical protein
MAPMLAWRLRFSHAPKPRSAVEDEGIEGDAAQGGLLEVEPTQGMPQPRHETLQLRYDRHETIDFRYVEEDNGPMNERAVDHLTIWSETGSQSGYVRADNTQSGYVQNRWLWECGWCEATGSGAGPAAATAGVIEHLGAEGCE